MDGHAISQAIIGGIIVIAVAAFGLGALVMWGVPRLWELLKPWLHTLTA